MSKWSSKFRTDQRTKLVPGQKGLTSENQPSLRRFILLVGVSGYSTHKYEKREIKPLWCYGVHDRQKSRQHHQSTAMNNSTEEDQRLRPHIDEIRRLQRERAANGAKIANELEEFYKIKKECNTVYKLKDFNEDVRIEFGWSPSTTRRFIDGRQLGRILGSTFGNNIPATNTVIEAFNQLKWNNKGFVHRYDAALVAQVWGIASVRPAGKREECIKEEIKKLKPPTKTTSPTNDNRTNPATIENNNNNNSNPLNSYREDSELLGMDVSTDDRRIQLYSNILCITNSNIYMIIYSICILYPDLTQRSCLYQSTHRRTRGTPQFSKNNIVLMICIWYSVYSMFTSSM